MNIIKRYLAQEILSSSLLICAGLMAMFSFFDLIQELDNIGRGAYNIGTVLLYVLLSVPGHVYEVTPVAMLLGALYALAQLAHSSELVVMRTSGLSLANIASALLRVGLVFAVLTFIVGEIVTPVSERAAQRLKLEATDAVVAEEFRSGLWVKDGSSFVNIEEVLPDTSLHRVHIYEFGPDFTLRLVSNAETGFYENNRWNLRDVTQTQFTANKIETARYKEAQWQSVIQPELLNVLLVVPEKMAAWNLYSYIQHLRENSQKTTRQQIALWSKIVYPVACLVMVILAMPFGFLQQRSGGVSAKIFIGIMIGLSYQIINRLFVHLGLLNDWPPFISATVPTFLFMVGGMGMLAWMERR